MKKICFTGDSHTWGEGASGLVESFNPPVLGGDKRFAGFEYPSYVNLIRKAVLDKTNSINHEYTCNTFKDKYEMKYGCICVDSIPLKLREYTGLIRITLKCLTKKSTAKVFIDNKLCDEVNLMVNDDYNAYRILSYDLEDIEHELCIEAFDGPVYVYRIETYSGEYAVVNCGVGSTSATQYLDNFWSNYVESICPDVIVMEAHSINDWIDAESPEHSRAKLVEGINLAKAIGAKTLLLGVSPILEKQYNNNNICYSAYIEASKQAADDTGCTFIDSFSVMSDKLHGLSEDEKRKLMFYDKWHVNNLGHKIYAELVLNWLKYAIPNIND